MAFDMTHAASVEVAPATSVTMADEFDGHGRLAVLTGAAALGAMAAAVAAFSIGRLDPMFAMAAVAVICGAAAFVACGTFLESCDQGRPLAMMLIGLHIVSLIALPIVLQAAPAYTLHAAFAAMGTLLAFATLAHLSNGAVARLGAHAGLFVLGGAYYLLYGLMA